MNTTERREFLRAELNVFVTEENFSSSQIGKAIDVCEAGIRYVKPSTSAARGSREVTIEFQLPENQDPIQVTGQVVSDVLGDFTRTTSLQFVNLNIQDAEILRSYVLQRKRAELFEQMRRQHLSA